MMDALVAALQQILAVPAEAAPHLPAATQALRP
jgi:hypothetical protein